jgi:hypothetical protein
MMKALWQVSSGYCHMVYDRPDDYVDVLYINMDHQREDLWASSSSLCFVCSAGLV